MKIKLLGCRHYNGFYISVPKKYLNNFPPYFFIEIDTSKLIKRKKRQTLQFGKHTKNKVNYHNLT